MKKLLGIKAFVALVAAGIVGGSAASAQSGRATADHSGDYASLLFIGSLASLDDTTANTGSVSIRNDSDTVAALGLAVGYNWAKKGFPLRTEIEYHYRVRFDHDFRANSAGYENQLETHAVLVNSYADWQVSRTWALYGGGGIGMAYNLSVVDRDPLGSGGGQTERSDGKANFAWNVALGAIWSISKNWDADFRYRYVHLGEVESGPHVDGRTFTADNYVSHDFIIGVTYRF